MNGSCYGINLIPPFGVIVEPSTAGDTKYQHWYQVPTLVLSEKLHTVF